MPLGCFGVKCEGPLWQSGLWPTIGDFGVGMLMFCEVDVDDSWSGDIVQKHMRGEAEALSSLHCHKRVHTDPKAVWHATFAFAAAYLTTDAAAIYT